MLEETTKQSKVVVKNKPTEPLPCVGSEVVVGYNPNEFYLMKSSELPVIEDLRGQKAAAAAVAVASSASSSAASTATLPSTAQQFTFVCVTEEGELIEETVQEQEMFLDDEEQLLEQVRTTVFQTLKNAYNILFIIPIICQGGCPGDCPSRPRKRYGGNRP